MKRAHRSFDSYIFARDTIVSISRCTFQPTSLGICLLTLATLAAASGCNVASSGLNAEGTRHYLSGNHRAAVTRFNEAIRTDPTNPDSYYNLGATYHQLAKVQSQDTYWDQAETYYNQCLDVAESRGQEHVECYRSLAVLLVDRGQNDKAFTLLKGWTNKSPHSAEAKVELARLHHEFGDASGEEQQLLAATQLNPHHTRARTALGQLREKEGDYTQALANYAHSLSSNHAQPHVAARVSALQSAGVVAPTSPLSPTGTRVVTLPSTPRY